jgi:hypothetical protein
MHYTFHAEHNPGALRGDVLLGGRPVTVTPYHTFHAERNERVVMQRFIGRAKYLTLSGH